ncbi:MAG: ASCH domain-containing protein [Acidimicrobiales bacterium]
MLFEQRFWEPIARGEVTVTFRRWKRRQALAGRRYRTAGGIIEVDAIDVIAPEEITDADAVAGLYPSAEAILADLRGTPDLDLYRIRFHLVTEPDPRAVLAGSADLSPDDAAEIDRRLERLDRASSHGAWTLDTLRLVERRPETRAGDLADEVGRERLAFKTDVRKLKNLGLTLSLGVGYRLSPRGEAYLRTRS